MVTTGRANAIELSASVGPFAGGPATTKPDGMRVTGRTSTV